MEKKHTLVKRFWIFLFVVVFLVLFISKMNAIWRNVPGRISSEEDPWSNNTSLKEITTWTSLQARKMPVKGAITGNIAHNFHTNSSCYPTYGNITTSLTDTGMQAQSLHDTVKAYIKQKHFRMHEYKQYSIQRVEIPDISLIENVAKYFYTRENVLFPYDFKFLINGSKICNENCPPFLLIMCLSVAKDNDTRDVIRRTWGSVVRYNVWPGVKGNITGVKLFFIVGETDSEADDKITEKEALRYGDIVKAAFMDTYRNLSVKVLMGFRWATIFCPGFTFFMKADDDTFVNIWNAISLLKTIQVSELGTVVGSIHTRNFADRINPKWKLTMEEYPFEYYPPYAYGQTYILSANLVSPFLSLGQRTPYISIEDVYITGILASVVGVEWLHHDGFPDGQFHVEIKEFLRGDRISATDVNNKRKENIWNFLNSKNGKK